MDSKPDSGKMNMGSLMTINKLKYALPSNMNVSERRTNKISFADLKKGDNVTVNYLKFKNGERHAEKVNNKTLAAKLAKLESEQEQQAKPVQVEKKENIKPKTQPAPAQKKAVQPAPVPEAKTIQKEETKSEVKKETNQTVK